jgi:cytochrome c
MKSKVISAALITVIAAFAINVASAAEVDADAAKKLAKSNDCFKCHAEAKTKKGPSYKSIAAKYKGKADAEATLVKQITTGPKVKLEDGTEDVHKIIDTKDAKAQKNLVNWILSI